MIFVITGFSYIPFDRLVRYMDIIAGEINEEVIIQKGSSLENVVNARSYTWMDDYEMTKCLKRARVVVCHAGIGTILDCRKYEKECIIMPRRKKYGELSDDHQIEITRAIEESGRGIVAENLEEVRDAINSLANREYLSVPSSAEELISTLKEIVLDIEKGK